MKQIIAIVLSLGLLSACQNGQANNEVVGTLVGAGLFGQLGGRSNGATQWLESAVCVQQANGSQARGDGDSRCGVNAFTGLVPTRSLASTVMP